MHKKNKESYPEKIKLQKIVDTLGCEVFVPRSLPHDAVSKCEITAIAALDQATPGQISFLTNPKWRDNIFSTKANVIILAESVPELEKIQLICANPYSAMAKTAQLFFHYQHPQKGQSSLAYISETAEVDPSAVVFPFVYIGPEAKVKADVVLYPHVYIGTAAEIGSASILFSGVSVADHCRIGANNIIHANTVIGADGFGFAPDRDALHKIPQVGSVTTGVDVEIGAICSIDRATFATTEIGDGSKLDSHVHVGHNVKVGKHTMLCAQSGIAGSAELGSRVILAGQAGVTPGLKIGDGVVLGARAAALQDMPSAGEYLGIPAGPSKEWVRQSIAIRRLPELLKKISALEKTVAKLQRNAGRSHP